MIKGLEYNLSVEGELKITNIENGKYFITPMNFMDGFENCHFLEMIITMVFATNYSSFCLYRNKDPMNSKTTEIYDIYYKMRNRLCEILEINSPELAEYIVQNKE